MPYRNSASFGKSIELIVFDKLLRRGFEVYLPLVDDQEIDCVVRREVSGKPVYLDIQIKARSKECKPRGSGSFSYLKVRKPRPNFFYIFYVGHADCYWVMPSTELIKQANKVKTGKHKGEYKIDFTNWSEKTGLTKPKPCFAKYQGDFDLLRKYEG